MAKTLMFQSVTGPQGTFEVSTIWTDAGGANVNRPMFSPFSSADYIAEIPWPFETVVFRPNSSRGMFHRAHATEAEALTGHADTVSRCESGTLPIGAGVYGPYGNPTLTAEEWLAQAGKR